MWNGIKFDPLVYAYNERNSLGAAAGHFDTSLTSEFTID